MFGKSHIDEVAEKFGIPVLAKLPIDPSMAEAFDGGNMETVDTDCLSKVIEIIE